MWLCLCATAGLLAVPGFQAAGGSQGVGGACGWAAEETPSGPGDPGQAAHLRTLH